MKLLNPAAFAAFVKQRAEKHDGYIMCAIGQDPRKLHRWYFDQYKDRAAYSAAQEAKALHWKAHAERVWDCQGLADGYVTEMTGTAVNVRARNNYADWCSIKGSGAIPAERRVPGAAVFMHSTYVHHVGYLIEPVDPADRSGDWYVGEARGVMFGVVITRLSQRAWNRWGWMTKYFDYSMFDEIPETPEYGQRNLKRGMHGSDVAALQRDLIALGYSCGKWGADGDFGRSTRSALKAFQHDNGLDADGIAGPKTFAKLNALLKEDGEAQPEKEEQPAAKIRIASGIWHIRAQPSKLSAKLGYARAGDELAATGEKTEGWIGVMLDGEAAWISKKAVSA